ncbi:A/G-specific adenine glycosylase [Pedobacter sp. SYSU D00535]|uniref:A/G-specific adenine glycosylase n=1 Tax=Pedobacter sp. SYSU D00535 TaxID=2810308 RepID=UPI001A97492A|nr:A/G-specific adenine glycosylase [Pedobacter sp. SYSU D00535]
MSFITDVIGWYGQHKRDLPWRKTRDPYVIWLSEIILQQTRVEQGLPYFERFVERFPTVRHFAEAEEDEILKLWQGLGYYSRGRNMHTTAKVVMQEHGGVFPTSYDKLIKLKGIGEYTAAAISSFCADEAKAVVDGNVYRVLSRFFKIEEPIDSSKAKRTFTSLANNLIDPAQPGTSNQALMEFGALHCKPVNPYCPTCPLRLGCGAYQSGMVDVLPLKSKKTKVRDRYFNYFVLLKNESVVLSKRGPKDIWENLYELPLFETEKAAGIEILSNPEVRRLFGSQIILSSIQGPVKHVLSHQKLYANFIVLTDFEDDFLHEKEWIYVPLNQLTRYAMPKLIFGFLENFITLKTSY